MLLKLTLRKNYILNEDGELEKICRGCGEYLYADNEFFFNDTRTPDGLQYYCKWCQREHKHKKESNDK